MKTTDQFSVCLAQLEVVPGDPETNVRRMVALIGRHAPAADLIAFPELAVSGYLVGDLWLDESWVDWLTSFNATLQRASAEHGVAVLYGNVCVGAEAGARNQDGRRRQFNAAYLFDRGVPAARAGQTGLRLPPGVQPKSLLPTYRFFDDRRYFFSLVDQALDDGADLAGAYQPFLVSWRPERPVRLGVQICEDLWCEDYRYRGRSLNVARFQKNLGAELVVNVSSSPWTYGKNAARDRRIAFLQRDEAAVPFLYVNRVGAENCGDNVIVYDGGSTAYGADGTIRGLAAADFREDVLLCALRPGPGPGGELALADAAPALVRPEPGKIVQKHAAVRQGLRHLTRMTGLAAPRFLLGLSGGVDSAVVAALLVESFGPDQVMALTMPSRHTSQATLANAHHVAAALGITLRVAPIDAVVDAARREIDAVTGGDPDQSLAHENEQARLRGSVFLAGVAARSGRIFPSNGNKLEVALGYSTLYGDVDGAIAPIADLTKVEVIALARHLNAAVFGREVIPANLLPADDLWRFAADGVQPSAELRGKQVDPMRFGYHDALLEAVTDYRKASAERVAGWYLEGTLHRHLDVPVALLRRWGLDDPATFVQDLEWFCGQLRRNVFKRVQSPPIIITSKSAYGYDIREAIGAEVLTAGYRQTRAQILRLEAYRPSADDGA